MTTSHDDTIEPLSDAAWQRIERGIFEQLAHERAPAVRRHRLHWAIAAAAAVLVGIGVAITLQRGGGAGAQHYVTRGDEQTVKLPGLTVHLTPGSELDVTEPGDASVVCKLEHGEGHFEVASRKGRAPLFVLAGDVRVKVVGTVFVVRRAGTSAEVETREGVVRVSARGQSVLVRRGERWPSLQPAAADEHPTEPPPSAAGAVPERVRSVAERQRERFDEAVSWESREPERALRAYEALARESGAWASNALFALGRLELERGLRRAAERDLRRYLQRYPRGPNALDAHALLSRINR